MFVKKVEDLKIYIISLQLANEIHGLIEEIPNWWALPDAKQIKRSSSSVPANISEGFGQRFYVKKFLYYLSIAKGSSDESQTHLGLLVKKGYITEEKTCYYLRRCKNLSVRMLNFINYLKEKHNINLH